MHSLYFIFCFYVFFRQLHLRNVLLILKFSMQNYFCVIKTSYFIKGVSFMTIEQLLVVSNTVLSNVQHDCNILEPHCSVARARNSQTIIKRENSKPVKLINMIIKLQFYIRIIAKPQD